ncbi:MAG: nuclear transport factor 2 family protein [Deltaproteobacteria bacterium]|nr:nuclear transport factor 2 family protein [Deltaproteobacteria bacterium]
MKGIIGYSAFCIMILVAGCAFFSGCTDNTAQNREMLQAIEDLKKEVQTMKDVEAIKQLHIRYVNDLTYGEWDDIVECFAEDAVLAVMMGQEPTTGKEKIRDIFMNQVAKSDKHTGSEANMTLHPLVTVDGDTAKSNWVIYFITQPDKEKEAVQVLQGIYDCEYKREIGEWKISYIKWTPRFALGPQISDQAGGPPGETPAGQSAPK